MPYSRIRQHLLHLAGGSSILLLTACQPAPRATSCITIPIGDECPAPRNSGLEQAAFKEGYWVACKADVVKARKLVSETPNKAQNATECCYEVVYDEESKDCVPVTEPYTPPYVPDTGQ